MAEEESDRVFPETGSAPPLLDASAQAPGARSAEHPDRVLVDDAVLKKHPDDKVLGRVVAGKYAVYDVLGMGGFGAVYRAIQEPVGRPVALKVVHARNAEDPELRARFFREAKVVARLNDRAVVTLHDYGEEPDLGLYMVFELVEGVTLNRLIKEGPQPPERVVSILLQLLRALSEAHGLGMIHRDLKPGNVMIADAASLGEEMVRLLDFGIAKVMKAGDQEQSLETQRGLVMGTPRYLSPEQARATGEIDLRSDLYSLAVIGYALLAGNNPFERPSVIETIMAHCHTPPPPLEPSLGVPPALEAALAKALEKEPDDRYASAREMAEALRGSMFVAPRGGTTAGFPSLTGATPVSGPSTDAAALADPDISTPLSGTWTGQFSAPETAGTRRGLLWLVAGMAIVVLGFGVYRAFVVQSAPVLIPVEGEAKPSKPSVESAPKAPQIIEVKQEEPPSLETAGASEADPSGSKKEPDPGPTESAESPNAAAKSQREAKSPRSTKPSRAPPTKRSRRPRREPQVAPTASEKPAPVEEKPKTRLEVKEF